MHATHAFRTVTIITGPGCYAFGEPTDAERIARENAYAIADVLRNEGFKTMTGCAPMDDLLFDQWEDDTTSNAPPVSTVSVIQVTEEAAKNLTERYGTECEVVTHTGVFRTTATNAPVAYILVGLPASGKTTWRERETAFFAANDSRLIAFSSDDIIEAEAERRGCTYNEAFKDADFKAINRAMTKGVRDAVRSNANIVIDRTNLSRNARKRVLMDIPAHYRKVAVVCQAPDAIVAERLCERPGKTIPADIHDRMKRDFVAPTRDEGFDDVIEDASIFGGAEES